MLALFQNEWVVAGTIIALLVVGIIGWRRVGRWLFGGRDKSEVEAKPE